MYSRAMGLLTDADEYDSRFGIVRCRFLASPLCHSECNPPTHPSIVYRVHSEYNGLLDPSAKSRPPLAVRPFRHSSRQLNCYHCHNALFFSPHFFHRPCLVFPSMVDRSTFYGRGNAGAEAKIASSFGSHVTTHWVLPFPAVYGWWALARVL